MFGYVMPDFGRLNEEEKKRFRSLYCGLCRCLREESGLVGSATLSYDMTFLAMLLGGLYEPEETIGFERCAARPARRHAFAFSEPFRYAADMNLALTYHKCTDNWLDDKNPISKVEASILEKRYADVKARHPDRCAAIEDWLMEIHRIERADILEIDAPAQSTGRMLGRLFQYEDDCWSEPLYRIGNALGQFIYFMDAYEDLPKDILRKRYNPLKGLSQQADYEELCREALTMLAAECTREFEDLPILRDAELLRNILYSGLWNRYARIQKARRGKGEK